jgi:hypothetical protein
MGLILLRRVEQKYKAIMSREGKAEETTASIAIRCNDLDMK